jgi:hypothetical protein
MIEAIGQAFRAAAEFFGWRRQRDAAQNSPEIKANAAAETRAEIRAEAQAAVAKDDLDEIRRKAAE